MSKNISILIKFSFFFGILFQTSISSSQVHDTLAVYKKIKKVTSKHKFTSLLYDAVFVDPAPQQYENKPLSDNQKKKDPNQKYEGEIIRTIDIKVLDPFGYSVSDTSKYAINSFQKIANHYHVTTRNRVIRNNLLFKKNDAFDVYKFNESERILRTTDYVNDVQVYISQVPNSKDSVDIKLFVLDRWTVDAPVNASFTSISGTLIERNFLGLGQRFEQSGGYNSVNGNYQYGGLYRIANIEKTFISSNVFYATNQNIAQNKIDETTAGFSLDRGFYSALTKWAGGISETKIWDDNLDSIEKVYKYYHVENVISDLWVGRSFNPGVGAPVNRKGTNIIVALRYLDNHYQTRPLIVYDSNQKYFNSSLWLGSVAFSLRKYYKDRFIYRFGANEDIAEGALIQLLYGVKYQEGTGIRYYSGFQLSYGLHFEKIGYASAFANYGTFYYPNIHNDATFNAGFYYFSNLLQKNKWYFREFINFKYVNGINKLPGETITLNTNEMYGFDNGGLQGTKKLVLNLESVTYVPYNIIGFRFAPLILIGLGMLDTPQHQLLYSPVYQSYAIGVLVRNENLLNSSFQITYGYSPNLADDNSHNYGKFNPSIGFSIKVPVFAVIKPSVVTYQ
jgi:hypothetical protein